MANNKNKKYNQSFNKATNNRNNNYRKNNMSSEKNNTTSLNQKEINKRRYEARKQRYSQNANQEKKKVVKIEDTFTNSLSNTDILFPKKKNALKNNNLNIKNSEFDKEDTSIKTLENELNGEKDSVNKSIEIEKENNLIQVENEEQSGISKEDNNIADEVILKKKRLDITKTNINELVEKTIGDNISFDNSKEGKKKRVKKYLKEAIVFAIIITFINILVIWLFDDLNLLKLFDVMYANLIVTIILSLIVSYAISFFVDCLITEIWVKRKNKQKEGVQNGDNRIK